MTLSFIICEHQKNIVVAQVTKQTEHHYQITIDAQSIKLKQKDALFISEQPINTQVLDIDIDLLWEYAPDQPCTIEALCQEYFSECSGQHILSMLKILHKHPIYFLRHQNTWHKVDAAQLNLAKQAIVKRQEQEMLKQTLIENLRQNKLPESMQSDVLDLLFKPNKNSLNYKALDVVCKEKQTDVESFLLHIGAIKHDKLYHYFKFINEFFSEGVGFNQTIQNYRVNQTNLDDLPINTQVKAFSIDDSSTTEIDDAFSIQTIDANTFKLGIHIAAPALGIDYGDTMELLARKRLSTVYFPGGKITMLPEHIIQAFTLQEGKTCPAVSLYCDVERTENANTNAVSYRLTNLESKVERIFIQTNLRYDLMQHLVSNEKLNDLQTLQGYAHEQEIKQLWPLANFLFDQRQQMRQSFGLKVESRDRSEFSFTVSPVQCLENLSLQDAFEEETIELTQRQRGNPLDLIVAELMIFANQSWAQQINQYQLTAIYRTQKSFAGFKTRMQTHMDAHEGLGVKGYVWSTSPLRRYVDLMHQWQIIALARHGNTASLTSVINQNSSDALQTAHVFQEIYMGYQNFQSKMENYWALRWLQQNNMTEVTALTLKDGWMRLQVVPFSLKLPEVAQKPRGTEVKLQIISIDLLKLSVQARILND